MDAALEANRVATRLPTPSVWPILPRPNRLDLATSPFLAQLTNLQTGEVHARDTSYVARTNEVKAMVQATKEKQWPGLWYEILQGAWDWNDWKKGPPEILVYYSGKDSPIPLSQYLTERSNLEGRLRFLPTVDRVEVVNYIREGTGLRPRHVALTEHDEQSGDTKTLGLHGRGLSIATTAAIAGSMAEKITFLSSPQDMGTWYGEACMATDEVDPTYPPSLRLKYKNDKQHPIDTTAIAVHKPSEELLKALVELPNWFLPTNANYRFRRLSRPTSPAIPNRLTLFTDPEQASEGDLTISKNEANLMVIMVWKELEALNLAG
jgi:hypothetical protein